MVKIDFVNAQEPAINDTNLNQMQLNIENAINAQVSGDTLPVGCIVPFTSDTVPENWLLCDGQAVSRTEYALLFSIIGTTYGVGDGSTTFNLPNLKGRVAVGKDSTQTEFDNLGETGGEKTHTQTVNEMPTHRHILRSNYGNVTSMTYVDAHYGFMRDGAYIDRTLAATTSDENIYNTSAIGDGQPMNNLQPYQVTNYIIKARQSSGLVATVVDSLTSTSTTDALSANQGKQLKEMITGVEVFDGRSNGNITLSQSCEGAKFMEIYFSDQELVCSSVKIINPNGKTVNLQILACGDWGTTSWHKIKLVKIQGTNINVLANTETTIDHQVLPSVTGSNYIYINKVILYF